MNSESESFLQLDDEPKPARACGPLWNILAILLPAFGWFVGWAFLNGPSGHGFTLYNGSMGGTGLLLAAFLVVLPSAVIGFLCTIIAIVRQERLIPLTVLGFLINFPPLMLLLAFTIYLI